MTAESPNPKKNGHGAGSRERRLRALPHWPEIEIRLQHRWTPREVAEWHKRTWPAEDSPAWRTLYKFLEDKDASWYVEKLLVEQMATRRVPRILVIEAQAEMIQLQVVRVRQARKVEEAMNGIAYPQCGVEIERLDRMLQTHLRSLQDVGVEPRVATTRNGDGGGDPDGGTKATELSTLVHRIVDLPEGEFMPAVIALLGPPPVKQPLKIDGVVIEQKPLKSDSTKDRTTPGPGGS